METKRPKFPRSASSLRIGRAVRKMKSLTMAEHIDLMVKAQLMTKEEADLAKLKLAQSGSAS